MYKLLIVDDEKIVIDGLTSVVNWKENQVEIVGTATDGNKALQLILEKKPDIVLADIRMPGLNGLDLIQKTREILPDTLFIVISGYTEFNYAKKAIELEAIDYLVKPVEFEEIKNAINRAKVKHEQLKVERQNNLQLQKYESELEEKYILDCLLGRSNEHNQSYYGFYCFNVLKIGFKNSNWMSEIQKRTYQFFDKLKKLFTDLGYQVYVYIFEDSFVIMYAHNSQSIFEENFILQVSSFIEEQLRMSPTIGISDTCFDLTQASKSYKEAQAAFKISLYLNKVVLSYKQLVEVNNTIDIEVLKKVDTFFRNNGFVLENISCLVEEIVNYSKQSMLSPEKFKMLCFRLLNNLIEFVSTEFELEYEQIGGEKYPWYENLNRMHAIDEVHDWIQEVIRTILKNLNEKKISSNDKLILDVKNYLNNHFNKPISLDDMSECFHLNPAYLSSLFSKKVGLTIFEFITAIRITKAKELLRTTNLKVIDICKEVGYENQRYFNQVFKKQVGLTPGNYRSKHLIKSQ